MATTVGQWTHSTLRILAGILFMQHGVQKLFGWFGGVGGSGNTVSLMTQVGLAGVLEFVGGALLVIGLLTPAVAVVLLIEMLVAYMQAHFPQGGWPIQNRGEPALLFAAIFLFLAGNGAGPLSVDERWSSKTSRGAASDTPFLPPTSLS